MPTRVWLMRHAETARPEVFHGFESDVGLSERGERQAAAIAPLIASYGPDAIYSSGMLRARLTATPIAQACGLPIHVEPDLHERKVGKLVGQPAQPELGIWPDTLRRWIDGDTSFAPDGAESYDAIQQRVLPIWDRITQQNEQSKVVIVCHGIICRVLLLSILPNHSVADWTKLGRIQNLSISELVGNRRNWQAARIAELPDLIRDLA